MYLRTCSISYMHCTMVYGMLIKLQLQLQFVPPFMTIASFLPRDINSISWEWTIWLVHAPGLVKLHTSNFVFRYWLILAADPWRWLSQIIFPLWSYLLILLPGTRDEIFSDDEGVLVSTFVTLPLIIVGILLPALGWIMFFSVEFVADGHSQLLLGFISTVWFSMRLVSGVKRFEDLHNKIPRANTKKYAFLENTYRYYCTQTNHSHLCNLNS